MTSYLPDEIRWGYRFERLITHQRDDGKYMFDYASFHNTIEVDLPFCSAADLAYGSFNLHQQEKSVSGVMCGYMSSRDFIFKIAWYDTFVG